MIEEYKKWEEIRKQRWERLVPLVDRFNDGVKDGYLTESQAIHERNRLKRLMRSYIMAENRVDALQHSIFIVKEMYAPR